MPAKLALICSCVVLILSAGAHAQSSSPPASDSWSKPAPASTVHYGGGSPQAAGGQGDRFTFKDDHPQRSRDDRPDPNRPRAINDTSPLDNNGRPAASCASDPRQSKCHP